MRVITSVKEWRCIKQSLNNQSCGLVQTMGNLHQGHMSLVERSLQENEITILTIFVNQTQFNDQTDFKLYPRTLEKDLQLAKHHLVDYVLTPTYEELYPDNYRFSVTENSDYSLKCEGTSRPGHFSAMLTVVLKLLLLTLPTRAYFGEKDWQQLKLIQSMAKAFLLKTAIIPCKIIRNKNGLPLSSRNNRLSEDELKKAAYFSKLLSENLPLNKIKDKLRSTNFIVNYIEEFEGRRLGAVELNGIRLIDNIKV